MLCGLVFSHSANCARLGRVLAVLEHHRGRAAPVAVAVGVVPQLGMAATRQSPLVGAALVTRVFSPQTAVGQVSRVPSDRSLYHSEAKSGSTFTR